MGPSIMPIGLQKPCSKSNRETVRQGLGIVESLYRALLKGQHLNTELKGGRQEGRDLESVCEGRRTSGKAPRWECGWHASSAEHKEPVGWSGENSLHPRTSS